MAVTTVHAQLIRYTNSGTQVIVNLKSTGDDVSVSRSSNGNLPSSVSSVQGLANSLGALAFKNSIADATTSSSGLMTASMVSKLNGIASGANAYSHPGYTARSAGFYKVTVDGSGHVSNVAVVTKADITALGIPGSDTNTWRGIQDNLSSTSTSDSLSAAQGKLLNETKLYHRGISSPVDFDTLTTTGVYHISTSCSTDYHAPVTNHGTLISEFDVGTPYQIFMPDNVVEFQFKRYRSSGNWSGWTKQMLTNTWRSLGTTADTACAGNDSRLSNSRPASDVYAWAKASSKPSYSWAEITDKPSTFTPASHTHNYAGSGSAGGSANSAVKLDTTSAGSTTQPVYFTGGKPAACSYTLGKSVPSNAVFTDTNTWRGIQNNLTSDSTTDSLSAAQGKILNESKLMHKTIASAVDWDTLTETGIYHFRVSSTIADHHAAVEGYWGTLIVDFTVGTPYQIYIPDAISSHQYRRTYNGSAGKWNTNWVVQHFTDTTYGNATQSSSGLMSNTDKKKLDTTDFLKVQAATPTESCIWCKIDA